MAFNQLKCMYKTQHALNSSKSLNLFLTKVSLDMLKEYIYFYILIDLAMNFFPRFFKNIK